MQTLKKLQIKKALLNKKRARPEAEESSEEENVNGLVNPESIRGKHKKQKLSKEERIEGIKAGREGRVEFGAKAKLNKKVRASKTNYEKRKTKAFAMVKDSLGVRSKYTRSKKQHKTHKKMADKRQIKFKIKH